MKFRLKYVFIILMIMLIISLIVDLIRISGYDLKKSLPQEKLKSEINDIYYELENGATSIDWTRLSTTLEYIEKQYDVSDFRLATLVRLLYDYQVIIPDSVLYKIELTVFNFRYWMDEPGENGMCYWSENHQILFASSEYLIGQMYPDSIFHNDGLTGKEHMQKAEARILDWLEMRWNFGLSEFYSNVYYSETIGGMINLIDYAVEENISKKTSIVMDLLVYDVATQKSGNMFLSVSGRAYERNRKGGLNSSFNNITNHIWNPSITANPHLNYGFVASKNYNTPSVLKEIGEDTSPIEIKQSNGLYLSEYKKEGFFGSNERSIMMQWGSGAYSNYEVIRNSFSYIRKNNLFSNEFLTPFKYFDLTFLQITHMDKLISYLLNPPSDGVAIQKANTYTYRTKKYSLYTVQNYFPGIFADQQHVAGINLGNSFAVFHTHPALPDSVKAHSPNYWVGYGHRPHSAQDKNVSISIYNIPKDKSFMELELLDYTHAYFPTKDFDSVYITKNYAFGEKDSAYVALIGRNDLILKTMVTNDLIQKGEKTFWIIEAGSVEMDGSFEDFKNRILGNKIDFNEETLTIKYKSNNSEYQLTFNADFFINNNKINTAYSRYNSPYITAETKSKTLEFRFNKKYLFLDFHNNKREYN